ncbi:MAG: hypothetical protein QOF07_1296 [Bradyrhizobium sp.]|jgi:predicted MFS family arabinose efflux permease|nr:hypothetical protein [Bradyrhizobium sp.]
MHPNSATSSRPLHLAIGGLLSLAAAIGIGRFVYTPILPAMIADVPLSQSAAGIIGSANFIGYLLGAVVAGSVWRPRKLRSALLLALAASAATTAAMGLAGSMAAFILLRGAGGAASAFALVLSSTLILDQLHADGRDSLSSVHFAGVGAGIAASAALISALHMSSSTWQQMWLFSGLASFAITGAVAALVPNSPAIVKTPPAAGTLTSRSRIWPLVLAYGLFGFGYVITATFLVAMVGNSPGVQAFEPWIWIAVGLAAIPSVSLWSSLGNRIGILNALGAACFAEALGVAASVVWVNVWGLFLAAALLGGTFMGITALGLIAARRMSASPLRSVSLMTAAFGVGQIVGPAAAGFGYQLTGSLYLPSLIAALALCVAALLSLLPR